MQVKQGKIHIGCGKSPLSSGRKYERTVREKDTLHETMICVGIPPVSHKQDGEMPDLMAIATKHFSNVIGQKKTM